MLLGRHGVELAGLEFDSMIGSYLIDPTRSAHTLEDTALEHLGYKALLEEDLTGKGSKAVPLARQAPAGAEGLRRRARRSSAAARAGTRRTRSRRRN